MAISEERLVAFLEGELAPEESAAVEAAIAHDPSLAQRVRAERTRRARVARLPRAAQNKTPPERLVAVGHGEAGRPAELIDFSAARAKRVRQKRAPVIRKWSRRAMLAAVALLGLFIGAEFLLNPGETPQMTAADGVLIARGDLAHALSNRLSAANPPSAPLRIGPSFLSTDRTYCRSFAFTQGADLAGVACREIGGWRIRITAEGVLSTSPAYQASVAAMMQGQPLGAAAEAVAKARGWRA